jgi:hypothetical protein
VRLDADQETVWLTQAQMAELFDVKPQNITMHLKNIYAKRELEAGTCKDFLQVPRQGEREVKRKRKHYSLDAVISVGYRISSARATQFDRFLFSVAGQDMDAESRRLSSGNEDVLSIPYCKCTAHSVELSASRTRSGLLKRSTQSSGFCF